MATDGGRLVLVFDDGFSEEFDEIRPVLRSADAPACFAVNPETIGEPGYLTADQLRTLADDGCEIAAHGRRHRILQGQRLARDAEPGDDRLFVADHAFPDADHGIYSGDRLELADGSGAVSVTVDEPGRDEEEQYVDLASPIDERYACHETVLRPSEELLHDEVVGGAEDLLALGFDPRTFVFPYDAADVRAWSAARRHYDAIPNAAVRSLPNLPGAPLSDLRRYYLETDMLTPVEIGEYLDAVAETGGLGILSGHSAWDTVPPERVAWVVESARDRGIELTTFRAMVDGGSLSV